MNRMLIASAATLLLLGCAKLPEFHPYQEVSRQKDFAPTPHQTRLTAIKAIDVVDWKMTFESCYGTEEKFRDLFIAQVNERLKPESEAMNLVQIDRIAITEYSESTGIYGGTLYCVVRMEFSVESRGNPAAWKGVLTARSNDAEFPSMHPHQARMKNAVKEAVTKLTDLLAHPPK